jgi:lipoprotein-anchoring transpeptidase ErfK/SrfK
MSFPSRRASAVGRLASLSVLVLLASGCSGLSGAQGSGGPSSSTPSESQTTSATPTPTTPAVELNSNISEGSTVQVNTTVTAWANGGTLSAVILKPDGQYKENPGEVPGSVGANQATWQATRLLDPGRAYVLAITGVNSDGAKATTTLRFSTKDLSRDEEVYPNPIPGDGSTVGVAMPVVMTFDLSVENKAAFERAMKVTSVPAQAGSWRWVSDREAHWRPKVYWQPGTKVTLDAKLNGIPAGNGRFGQMDRTGHFTVGSSVVAKVDLAGHHLNLYQGGKLARTIPVTGGKPGFVTRSGSKVIMEKLWTTRMVATGAKKGDPDYYDLPDVKYAMRVTWSGEFLHAAPWSVGYQGYANVSHGCVGMSTDNAAWLFNTMKVGDPVIVSGTGRSLDEGNGWTDWNMSFESFAKGSALS